MIREIGRFALLGCALLLSGSPAVVRAAPASASAASSDSITWRDGQRLRRLALRPDRAAVLWGGLNPGRRERIRQALRARLPALRTEGDSAFALRVQLDQGRQALTRIRQALHKAGLANPGLVRPVFSRPGDDAPWIDSGEIIVQFGTTTVPGDVASWAAAQGLRLVQPIDEEAGFFLLACTDTTPCPWQAGALDVRPEVALAYPNWVRPRTSRAQTADFVSDPLFSQQWYLENLGQTGGQAGADIGAREAWDLVGGGRDHVVAVVDTGVQADHPDLRKNLRPELALDLVEGHGSGDANAYHGTAIAGLVAARGGNGIGLSGAAPTAPMAAVRLTPAHTDLNEYAALTHGEGEVSIYVNAWGPADDGHLEGPGPLASLAFKRGLESGRDGRGAIYVWAGGNGGNYQDNTNYDGFANRPEVIAVSATTHNGLAAYYTEPGATNWINAPGGDQSAALLSTDLTGPAGADDGDYTDHLIGSSGAAPLVAGVAALVLDANPALGWRELKQVLLESAAQNDPANPRWEINGAGHPVHPYYGFGRVDAPAAIELARHTWDLPTLVQIEQDFQAGQAIPEGGALEIELEQPTELELEYVQLRLDSNHPDWGQLGIELDAPSGLSSELARPHPSFGAQLDGGWTFGSARHWGENGIGQWRLRITDSPDPGSGQLRGARLILWGHRPPPPNRDLKNEPQEPEKIPALGPLALGLSTLGLLLLAAGLSRRGRGNPGAAGR